MENKLLKPLEQILNTALFQMNKASWDVGVNRPMLTTVAVLRMEYNIQSVEAVMSGMAVRGLLKFRSSKGWIRDIASNVENNGQPKQLIALSIAFSKPPRRVNKRPGHSSFMADVDGSGRSRDASMTNITSGTAFGNLNFDVKVRRGCGEKK